MKFILHVYTKDPWNTPWAVHVETARETLTTPPRQYKEVIVKVPTTTRSDGHTPCANWYLEGECSRYTVDYSKGRLTLE